MTQRNAITIAAGAAALAFLVGAWLAVRDSGPAPPVAREAPVEPAQPAIAAVAPAPPPQAAPASATPPETSKANAAALPAIKLPKVDFQNLVQPYRDKSLMLQYAHNPDIYIIDFASLEEQGETMNRIMALEEDRDTPRDRVLEHAEFSRLLKARGADIATFNYAHNYESPQLARFFQFVERDRLTLNDAETELRNALFDLHILRRGTNDGQITNVGKHALISVPQVNDHIGGILTKSLRASIAQHELSHGVFSLDDRYRQYVDDFWHRRLDENHRRRFAQFLEKTGYDISNEYLVINEWHAYVIHTNHPDFFSGADIGLNNSEMARIREEFVCGMATADDFMDDVMPRIAAFSPGERIDCPIRAARVQGLSQQ